jgi:hypothetical protein
MERGPDSRWNRGCDTDEKSGDGESERVGVALQDEVGDGVVEAKRLAEVDVEQAVPVTRVLLAEWGIEAVRVTERGDVGGCGAFAEHLDDGIAGHEVDKQEDDRDNHPQDRKCEEDAAKRLPESGGPVH